MRLRKFWVLALVVLVSVSVASAQKESGWYIGVGYGEATVEAKVQLPSEPPFVKTIDESANSARIFGGYRFIPYLAIEGGFNDFGQIDLQSLAGVFTYDARADGWDVELVGILPIAKQRVELFAKLGVARVETTERLRSDIMLPTEPPSPLQFEETTDSTNALGGVGVQVNLLKDKQLGLRIEWVTIDTKSDIVDFTNIQGAVLYRF